MLTTASQYLDSGGMYCCFLAFTSGDSIWIHHEGECGRSKGMTSSTPEAVVWLVHVNICLSYM